MSWLEVFTNRFDRQARLYPAVLILAPWVTLPIAAGFVNAGAVEGAVAIIAGCGGLFLLSHLARERGKRREVKLFGLWGGMPSVAVLRHADLRIDAITKRRLHRKLERLVTGTRAPTPDQELSDPAHADMVYAAWSFYVRTHTRDTNRFNLLFAENIHYNYRRNVWGLRPVGLITSSAGTALCSYLTLDAFRHQQPFRGYAIALTVFFIFLLLWAVVFNTSWVKTSADAYGERLAEAIDFLDDGPLIGSAINVDGPEA